jgi:hypothetical protein
MLNTYLTVPFQTAPVADFEALLSLDTDKNTAYYGDAKSTFSPADIAYLKIFPAASIQSYTLVASYGTFALNQANVPYPIVEYLNFAYVKEMDLTYDPYIASGYTFTSEWVGNDIGTILRADKKITIPTAGVGRLKCTYYALGDRLSLSNCSLSYETYSILCMAGYSDADTTLASASISFEGGAVTTAKISVVVKDVCTQTVIPNATVLITGANFSQTGLTDGDGKYTTSAEGTVGSTYTIKITATGYNDTDLDILSNDSFVLTDPADAS